jgi:similar to stage IV sporulation protein
MTESEIRKELKAGGLFVGSYIPALHIGELENRVLLSSDTLSWITVNLDGTVARVQVIERTEPQAGETGRLPANLVAGADGQIELIQLYRGNCLVKMGQAVKKGELLVSGIYESASVGLRYTRAAGQVLARTERVIRLEVAAVMEIPPEEAGAFIHSKIEK